MGVGLPWPHVTLQCRYVVPDPPAPPELNQPPDPASPLSTSPPPIALCPDAPDDPLPPDPPCAMKPRLPPATAPARDHVDVRLDERCVCRRPGSGCLAGNGLADRGRAPAPSRVILGRGHRGAGVKTQASERDPRAVISAIAPVGHVDRLACRDLVPCRHRRTSSARGAPHRQSAVPAGLAVTADCRDLHVRGAFRSRLWTGVAVTSCGATSVFVVCVVVGPSYGLDGRAREVLRVSRPTLDEDVHRTACRGGARGVDGVLELFHGPGSVLSGSPTPSIWWHCQAYLLGCRCGELRTCPVELPHVRGIVRVR